MPEQQLWNRIKEQLQKTRKGGLHQAILNAIQLESHTLKGQKHFTLHVPSLFHQSCIQPCLKDIHQQLQSYGGLIGELIIKKSVLPPRLSSLSPKIQPPKKAPPFWNNPAVPSSIFTGWEFSSFVEGAGNAFALAAAKSVAKYPCKHASNPLFIYGATGLGKTHLLLAIGNYIEQHRSMMKVRYLSAERFFNDCICHIQKNAMSAFREKYRKSLHILLLDDVQILGRGESTQEEFFHTFETLIHSGCQIVLASDRRPQDIQGLKDRLQTRFSGGLLADIQAPDKETKMAIIRQKAKALSLPLSEEVCFFLASLPTNSIREIEGHLNKVKMFCELQNTVPELSLLKKLFSSRDIPSSRTISIESIQSTVAQFFQLKISDLRSANRSQTVVYARHLAMFLIRDSLHLSLSAIGQLFGGRDHSSVLCALKKINLEARQTPQIKKDIATLQKRIGIPSKKSV